MKKLLLLLAIGSLAGFVYMRDGSDHASGLGHDRITTISTGEAVTIADHLSDDWTVIEFGADW